MVEEIERIGGTFLTDAPQASRQEPPQDVPVPAEDPLAVRLMDMQERVTAAEGYLSHMADRVRRCEERCDRMRSAMNLALLTVMASLGVDILVLLYHAGVIG